MSTLSPIRMKQLKQKAHELDVVVILGSKGLTDAVQKEISIALEAHELIKIRINAIDRDARNEIIVAICEAQQAHLIQKIGHLAVIYKKRQDKSKK